MTHSSCCCRCWTAHESRYVPRDPQTAPRRTDIHSYCCQRPHPTRFTPAPQSEDCPAGRFKALDELLDAAATPSLAPLLAATHSAHDTSPAGQQAAPADDSVRAAPAAEPSVAAGDAAALELGSSQRPGTPGPSTSPCSPAPPRPLRELPQQLACLCDVRDVPGSGRYYRLSDARTLAWLELKHGHAAEALSGHTASMDAGSAAAYALALLGEYVGEPWLGRLAKRLGVSAAAVATGTCAGGALVGWLAARRRGRGRAGGVAGWGGTPLCVCHIGRWRGHVRGAEAGLRGTGVHCAEGSGVRRLLLLSVWRVAGNDATAAAGDGAPRGKGAGGARPAPAGGASGPPDKKQKAADARAATKSAALAKQAAGTKKLTAFFGAGKK
jgi:hypothetical protein